MKMILFYFFLIALCLLSSSCETYDVKSESQLLPFSISSKEARLEDLEWSSDVLSLQMAIKKIRDNETAIINKLDPDIDPYKGYDPVAPKCRTVNLPARIFNDTDLELNSVLQFYSSQDKVLASCSNPDAVIKTVLQMLYCKKTQKLYTIKYFYKENKDWFKQGIAKCQ